MSNAEDDLRAMAEFVQIRAERDRLRVESESARTWLQHAALKLTAVEAERDRLRARVAWLRRAYGKAWLRRRTQTGLMRDLDRARRSAKAERDRLRTVVAAFAVLTPDAWTTVHEAVGLDGIVPRRSWLPPERNDE